MKIVVPIAAVSVKISWTNELLEQEETTVNTSIHAHEGGLEWHFPKIEPLIKNLPEVFIYNKGKFITKDKALKILHMHLGFSKNQSSVSLNAFCVSSTDHVKIKCEFDKRVLKPIIDIIGDFSIKIDSKTKD